MRIEGIIAAYSPESVRNSASASRGIRERSATEGGVRRKDSVEISDAARKHLEKVRSRIEHGFYNSDSVADDISDKLTGVLDEMNP